MFVLADDAMAVLQILRKLKDVRGRGAGESMWEEIEIQVLRDSEY
jgi:hypothetical protein